MPTYLPSGQVTALHPYVMHQQGVPHSVPSHGPPSHVGHFHSIPAMGSLQQWQNQQVLRNENIFSVLVECFSVTHVIWNLFLKFFFFWFQSVSEGLQISTQNEIQPSQADQNPMRSEANYNYEISVNGLALRQDYLDVHISQGAKTDSGITSSTGEAQVLWMKLLMSWLLICSRLVLHAILTRTTKNSVSGSWVNWQRLPGYPPNWAEPPTNFFPVSWCLKIGYSWPEKRKQGLSLLVPVMFVMMGSAWLLYWAAGKYDSDRASLVLEQAQEPSVLTSTNHGLEGQVSTAEQLSSAANPSSSDASIQSVNLSETAVNNATGAGLSESFVSTRQENTLTVGKTSEPALLDERSLLACIVRTTAGGRIRISSTVSAFTYKHATFYLFKIDWLDYIC